MLGAIVFLIFIASIVWDELDRQRREKEAIEQYKRDIARWRDR